MKQKQATTKTSEVYTPADARSGNSQASGPSIESPGEPTLTECTRLFQKLTSELPVTHLWNRSENGCSAPRSFVGNPNAIILQHVSENECGSPVSTNFRFPRRSI